MNVATLLIDLQIALMNLLEHRRRTAFLGTAIAVVTALFVLLTALSAGVRSTLVDTALTLSTGHLNVGGFFKPTAGQAGPFVTDAPKVKALVERSVPELAFASERGRGYGKIVSDQSSLQVGITGLDIQREPAFKSALQPISGKLDDLAEPNTIVIFEAQAKRLEVKVGDALTISAQTSRGVANTVDVRVAAIARDIGLLSQFSVFVPNEVIRTLYQLRPDVAGVIQLYLQPRYADDLAQIGARLRKTLEGAGHRMMPQDGRPFWMKFESVTREDWSGQKLDVTTWEDELSFMMWSLNALQGLTAVLMMVLIAIVVTGIMNTLWIAIRERTREIGTLRAIGMQRGGIARLFLFEAAFLGALSGTAGVCLGAFVAFCINLANIKVPLSVQMFLMRDTVSLRIEPSALGAAIGMITFVTAGAALYPSLRAARLKPVDAMAHFG
jgi:ABC-type lipoprotein release transport system permease subunit